MCGGLIEFLHRNSECGLAGFNVARVGSFTHETNMGTQRRPLGPIGRAEFVILAKSLLGAVCRRHSFTDRSELKVCRNAANQQW